MSRLGAGLAYAGGGLPGGDDVVDELLRGKDRVARGQRQGPGGGEVGAAARRADADGVRPRAGAGAGTRDVCQRMRLAALHPAALRAGVREEPAVAQAGERPAQPP